MHGVLAFGDSITNGGGELQWGVALQSWALWTARGLGLPYTGYAVDGATVDDVVARADPARRADAARSAPDARYHVGCLYIGVNDVRRDGLGCRPRSPAPTARRSSIWRSGASACSRVHAPARLGRPGDAGRPGWRS